MPMISPALLEDVKPKHTHSQTLHENPITIDVVSEIQEILDEASQEDTNSVNCESRTNQMRVRFINKVSHPLVSRTIEAKPQGQKQVVMKTRSDRKQNKTGSMYSGENAMHQRVMGMANIVSTGKSIPMQNQVIVGQAAISRNQSSILPSLPGTLSLDTTTQENVYDLRSRDNHWNNMHQQLSTPASAQGAKLSISKTLKQSAKKVTRAKKIKNVPMSGSSCRPQDNLQSVMFKKHLPMGDPIRHSMQSICDKAPAKHDQYALVLPEYMNRPFVK